MAGRCTATGPGTLAVTAGVSVHAVEHGCVGDARAPRLGDERAGDCHLPERRRTRDHVDFAVLATVPALAAHEMPGMELVVVPTEMKRPNVQRPAEAISSAGNALACTPVVVVAVQSRAADEREDAADRLLDDLVVDDYFGGESGLLDRRQVGLIEPDAEQAEVGMAIEDAEHPGQPARGQSGHDEVGIGDDDRIARGGVDAELKRRPVDPRKRFSSSRINWWKRARFACSQLRTSGPDALSTIVIRNGAVVRVSRASTVPDQVVETVVVRTTIGGVTHR